MAKSDKIDELVEKAEEQYFEENYEAAEKSLLSALESVSELGQEDLRYASILNTLAGVYRATGREEQALEPCLRAFAIMERECEKGDSDVAGIARNIGFIYNNCDRHADAQKWLEKAADIYAAAEEPDAHGYAQTMSGLAEIYTTLGDSEKQLDALERGYRAARDGRMRDTDARMAIAYADALADQNRIEEARDELKSLIDEYIEQLNGPRDLMAIMDPAAMTFEMIREEFKEKGVEPPALLLLRVQHEKLRRQLGETDDSIADLPEMGTFEGRIYGENSRELGMHYQQVGVLLHLLAQESRVQGHFDKALSYYERSLAILEKQCPPDDTDLLQARENLAELQSDIADL